MPRDVPDDISAQAPRAPLQPDAPDASAAAVAAAGSEAPAAPPERRTASVELLWDLVFVFAVTQVATLLAHDPGWVRLGEGMLVLALVWWAWSVTATS